MKYIFILLPLFLSGCESLNFYTNKVFTEEPKNYYRTETINNWQIFGKRSAPVTRPGKPSPISRDAQTIGIPSA